MSAKKIEEIVDGLYLTARTSAQNPQILEFYKITHILTVALEIDLEKICKHMGMTYKKVPADDYDTFPINAYFDEMGEFIDEALKSKGKIIVHCAIGASRSPTAIMAYLIKYRNMTTDEAFSLLRRKRPLVNPNEGFMEQLHDYEKKIHKKSLFPSEEEVKAEPSESKSPLVFYRCKSCRTELFAQAEIVHGCDNKACTSYFLERVKDIDGKLYCLKEACAEKIGEMSVSGEKCSCGVWIAPSFRVTKCKVDFFEKK